jgi:hypothetical protein
VEFVHPRGRLILIRCRLIVVNRRRPSFFLQSIAKKRGMERPRLARYVRVAREKREIITLPHGDPQYLNLIAESARVRGRADGTFPTGIGPQEPQESKERQFRYGYIPAGHSQTVVRWSTPHPNDRGLRRVGRVQRGECVTAGSSIEAFSRSVLESAIRNHTMAAHFG